jgi:hypothetical protein
VLLAIHGTQCITYPHPEEKSPALEKFSRNPTELACLGKISSLFCATAPGNGSLKKDMARFAALAH